MVIFLHSLIVIVGITSALFASSHHGEPHEQEQFIPYWTLEPGWHSEVQLRNNLQVQNLEVTAVLRLSDGTQYSLPPVTIPRDGMRMLNLRQAATMAAGNFGSLVVRYRAVSQRNLTASIMIHFDGRPIDFHLDATSPAPDPLASYGGYNGIWWIPLPDVSQYLVLSNYSGDAARAQLTLFGSDGSQNHKLAIPVLPRQTVKLDLSELLRGANLSGSFGGLQIRYLEGSQVYPFQFSYQEASGFSALMKLHRRYPGDKSSEVVLRAPMVALKSPDPALKFPAGTELIPHLFVRNTLDRPMKAEVVANWRSESAWGTASLGVHDLGPEETKLLDLSKAIGQPPIPPEANWAGVAVRFAGREGDVLALSNSYDSAFQHGLQSPFSAQLAGLWMGGAWSAGANTNSLITIGNGGAKPTTARIRLNYEGGSYEVVKALVPEEQVWVNVEALRQESDSRRQWPSYSCLRNCRYVSGRRCEGLICRFLVRR